jgi:hypothetical protein
MAVNPSLPALRYRGLSLTDDMGWLNAVTFFGKESLPGDRLKCQESGNENES